VYRVRSDGTSPRKVIEQPIPLLGDVSPDGRFIVGWTALPGNQASAVQLFPVSGGAPVAIGGWWTWGPGGQFASITAADGVWSYVVPLPPGESFPQMPADALHSEKDVAQLTGARKVDHVEVPGPSADVYAFYRTTTQRNLFRIPIQ
jgi:hypothetical protein